jgi:triosephosphate isomerase
LQREKKRNAVDAITQCAQDVIETQYVSDAERLISLLGGSIEEKECGYLFSKIEVTVFLLGEQLKLDNHRDMVLWVMRDVASRYL